MAGNDPGAGATGLWTVVSGSGVFANPNAFGTVVSGLSAGPNVFKLTISNSCGSTNANVTIKPLSQDCKKYKFEMNYVKGMSVKDTCMEYYMVFYKGLWMDTMSQKEWDNLTDYQIGMEYDFPDADFLGYTQTRAADFTFKDTGRVLMYAQWWNKCLRQDTFMFRKLDVCKRTNSSEVKEVVKLEPMIVPNPADGGFIISMSGVTQYEVVDMNGRIVLKGEYREGDVISTENLKEGLYYVKTNRSLQPIVIKH
jgi:hypothetical protein